MAKAWWIVAVLAPVALACARNESGEGSQVDSLGGEACQTAANRHEYVPADAVSRKLAEFQLRERIVFEVPEDLLSSIGDVALGADGSLYVLDQRAKALHAFAPDGPLLWSRDDRGQGPGVFDQPIAVGTLGETVVVVDATSRLLHRWSTDGEFLGAERILVATPPHHLVAFGDSLVATYAVWEEMEPRVQVLAAFDSSGNEVSRLRVHQLVPSLRLRIESSSATLTRFLEYGVPRPSFAVSTDHVFVTSGDRYVVDRLGADGDSIEWICSDAHVSPYPEELRRWVIEMIESRHGEPGRRALTSLAWPQAAPAIRGESTSSTASMGLQVDGRGNLFVFPFVDHRAEGDWPVDVYSSTGELIHAGRIAAIKWLAARDDWILTAVDGNGGPTLVAHELVYPQ